MQSTSNSSEVAKLAPTALGTHGHTIAGHVAHLGVDFAGGKSRSSKGPRSKNKSRWNKGLRRLIRVKKLRGATVKKGKIFVCGIKPSLTYGEE
eukprot:6590991-Pyramimonas_sp.AAC.2